MSILSSSGGAQGAAATGTTAPSGRAGDGDVDVLAAFGGALANAIAALVPGAMPTPVPQINAAANDNVAGAGEHGDAGTTLQPGSDVGAGTPSAAVFLRAGGSDAVALQTADASAALSAGAAPLTAGSAAVAQAAAGVAALTAGQAGTGATLPAVSTEPAIPQLSPGETAATSGPGRPGHPAAAAGFNPAFRGRLERVIERMHDEYGIDVKVVEGLRSQARQDWLYEQGRTRPGPVVTWTHHSNHTQGLAADLQLANVGSAGYRTLAQVAEQEGLHTLGAADPGHVELKLDAAGLASGAGAATRSGAPPADVATAQSTGIATVAPVARPAAVADLARVALVAQIARVAAPAVPGQRSARPRPTAPAASQPGKPAIPIAPTSSTAHPESPEPVTDVGAVMASTDTPTGRTGKGVPTLAQQASAPGTAPMAGKQEAGSPDARNGERRSAVPEGPARASDASPTDGSRLEAFGQPATAGSGTVHATSATHAVGGVDVAARVAQVQAALDGAELRPLSRVLLHLGDSAEDGSVRVSLRGSSVEASIALADTGAAERLGERLGELRTALEQHGYETGPLAVRSAAAATDASLSGLAAASSERVVAAAAPQSGNASQERRDGSENRGAPQGGQDRPRPRREQRKENEA